MVVINLRDVFVNFSFHKNFDLAHSLWNVKIDQFFKSILDEEVSDDEGCTPQIADLCFHGYFTEVHKVRTYTTDVTMKELCQ